MDYKETITYLFNSAPLFQNIGAGAYKEGLENTHALDEHFGHPHRRYKTIHVAGTNGKGSCSHTIAAILQSAGYKVGLYTSPHLVDFRERIRVNGTMIPEQRVIDFVEQERAFFEPLHPSFFELTTALAFLYFAEENVDVAVIEVGLGGRLDCTNIISPLLSVITNISFDHMQFLGHTLPDIAKEKAGIMKAGIPVVVGETNGHKAVRDVFVNKALEVNTVCSFADESLEVANSVALPQGGRRYLTKTFGLLEGQLGGLCQEANTRTVLEAVSKFDGVGLQVTNDDVKRGFSEVCSLTGLMGRWQHVALPENLSCLAVDGVQPDVICDTGHNPAGLSYISQQLEALSCRELHVVIGMVGDKDVSGSLSLLPKNARYYFTQASVKRAMPSAEIAALANRLGLHGEAFPSVGYAFKEALSHCGSEDVLFVGGSSFIVADFLAFLDFPSV